MLVLRRIHLGPQLVRRLPEGLLHSWLVIASLARPFPAPTNISDGANLPAWKEDTNRRTSKGHEVVCSLRDGERSCGVSRNRNTETVPKIVGCGGAHVIFF